MGKSRDIEASDFLLTLGGPGATEPARSREFVADTFMHELGHNLGLHHGGSDDINDKPNYLSIMNYRFGGGRAFVRTDRDPRCSTTRAFAIPLDERASGRAAPGFGQACGEPRGGVPEPAHVPE